MSQLTFDLVNQWKMISSYSVPQTFGRYEQKLTKTLKLFCFFALDNIIFMWLFYRKETVMIKCASILRIIIYWCNVLYSMLFCYYNFTQHCRPLWKIRFLVIRTFGQSIIWDYFPEKLGTLIFWKQKKDFHWLYATVLSL